MDAAEARKEALNELALAKAIGDGDPEAGHAAADDAIITLLSCLGYDDVVEAWEGIEKWYA